MISIKQKHPFAIIILLFSITLSVCANNTDTNPIPPSPTVVVQKTPKPEPSPTIPAQTQEKSTIVYVTRTGTKYHSENCRYLSKSKIPVNLEKARQKYASCSVCKPKQENLRITSSF